MTARFLGTALFTEQKWQLDAACRGVENPDIFFPSAGAPKKQNDEMAEAKAICAECPVRVQCLEYALAYERCGIWGGLNERERKSLRRRRALARRKAAA